MVAGEPGPVAGPLALYVHVPFCLSLCPYCDFVVYTGRAAQGPASRLDALVRALHVELDLRAEALTGVARRPLESVYLGGGTPSLLRPAQVVALLDHADRRLGLAAGAEVTIEANPGPAERGDLRGFRAAGVTRLSLGAQSLEASLLRRLGRRHAPADVAAAVVEARRAGLRSVSLDLLTDVPGQDPATWERTLRAALALEPDHLSVYALALDDPEAEGLTGPSGDHLPLRPGARRWRERARAGQDQDRAAEMEALTDELTAAAGLRRYEIANLARPGHESRHNLSYWRRLPHEALGPGAHAFDGASLRRWNAARLDGYLAALLPDHGEPRLPPGGSEYLGPEDQLVEAAMLGLRLAEGLGPEVGGHPAIAPVLTWGREVGLVERRDERQRLTRAGRLLSNEVFARLLPGAALLVP